MSLVDKYDEELKEDIAKLKNRVVKGEEGVRLLMLSLEAGTEEQVEKALRDARKRGTPLHYSMGHSKQILDLMEWTDTVGSVYQSFPFRITTSHSLLICNLVFENFCCSINREGLTIKESEVLYRLMLEVWDIYIMSGLYSDVPHYYPTSGLMYFTANLIIKYNPDDLFDPFMNDEEPITTEWWQLIRQRILKECNIPRLESIIEQMHLPDVDVESAISNGDIQNLIKALDYRVFEVKESVIQALVKIKKPATKFLISALDNKKSNVRAAAAETLGRRKDPVSIKPLIQLLKDDDIFVRVAAAKALGRIKDPLSIEPLIQLLKDDDIFVRGAAGDALAKKGKPVVPALVMALSDSRNDVKEVAIETLGEIRDPLSIEPLIQLLKDDDIIVRGAAGDALAKKGKPVVPSLIEALNNDNDNIRNGAAIVLGRMKYIGAIDHLCRLLQSKHRNDRIDVIKALEEIACPTSTESLIETLSDKDRDVRQMSVEALGSIGDVRALMPLVNILKKDKDIGQNAYMAILRIFRKSIKRDSKEIADLVVRECITMLGDNNTRYCASAILTIVDYPVVGYLIGVLHNSKNMRIRRQIPLVLAEKVKKESEWYSEVLSLLCQSLRDKDKELKKNAAFALEKLQDPGAVDALIKALEDADVRFAAESALEKIQPNR